jgi:mannose-6-phosphate isomerase-like protein (cupin superfamily)
MDEQHAGDRPDVRHVAMAREDEVGTTLTQQREHVARVQDLVALTTGAGDGDEVVVADEDPDVGVAGEAFLDPAVVLAPDLALVDVGLRRVDAHQRHVDATSIDVAARVAGAERVLEEEVANVAGVVVPGHADHVLAVERAELLACDRILVGVPVVRQVAGDDDEVGLRGVDLGDGGPQELFAVTGAADVDIGDLRDQHVRMISVRATARAGRIGSMADYTLTNVKDVEDSAVAFGLSPDLEARFVRNLGLENSAISYQRLAPGFRAPFGHRHKEQEELYVILSGGGRLKLEDEIVDVRQWDLVRVPKETTRNFEAGPEGLELLAIGAPNTGPQDAETIPGWWTT